MKRTMTMKKTIKKIQFRVNRALTNKARREYLIVGFICSGITVLLITVTGFCFLFGIGRVDLYTHLGSRILIVLAFGFSCGSIFTGAACSKAFNKAFGRKMVRAKRRSRK